MINKFGVHTNHSVQVVWSKGMLILVVLTTAMELNGSIIRRDVLTSDGMKVT